MKRKKRKLREPKPILHVCLFDGEAVRVCETKKEALIWKQQMTEHYDKGTVIEVAAYLLIPKGKYE